MGIRRKLGQRIRTAREGLGFTQQILADTLGVNRAVISDWENGKTSPNLDRMDVLAAFLKKPMSYFFTDQTAMEGHQVENPAFFVQAYNKTVTRLREMELDLRKQAAGMRALRLHFISQAELLLDDLTADQRQILTDEELDWAIKDPSVMPEGTRERRRDKNSSLAFASINALPRLMDDVQLDGMESEQSLLHQVRTFLRDNPKPNTEWGRYLREAQRIFFEIPLSERDKVVSLRRIVNALDNVFWANKYGTQPHYDLDCALEASRALAQAPARAKPVDPLDDEKTPENYAEEALSYPTAADSYLACARVTEFWEQNRQADLDRIPF